MGRYLFKKALDSKSLQVREMTRSRASFIRSKGRITAPFILVSASTYTGVIIVIDYGGCATDFLDNEMV